MQPPSVSHMPTSVLAAQPAFSLVPPPPERLPPLWPSLSPCAMCPFVLPLACSDFLTEPQQSESSANCDQSSLWLLGQEGGLRTTSTPEISAGRKLGFKLPTPSSTQLRTELPVTYRGFSDTLCVRLGPMERSGRNTHLIWEQMSFLDMERI